MKALLFFSRVAFICNICFLLAMLIQWMPNPPQGDFIKAIIVLGYIVAVVLNLLVNIWFVFLLFSTKSMRNQIPAWLVMVNFLFLIPQAIVYL